MAAFLVDTNVLVYAIDNTDGEKRRQALDTLRRVRDLHAPAITTQIVGEFFVTATRKIPSPLSNIEAAGMAKQYIASWNVLDVTVAVVELALRGAVVHQLHYYDALVWSAARLHDIPYILTEDGQHGRIIEGVRYLNPFAPEFDPGVLAA